MRIKALTFDTGGTILDWHAGLFGAIERVGQRCGLSVDWHEVVNDWRRRAMKAIVGQLQPEFNMDDMYTVEPWTSLLRTSGCRNSPPMTGMRCGVPGTLWIPGRTSRRRWPS